jgi:hypothetical protein
LLLAHHVSSCPKLSWAHSKGRDGLDAKVWELTLLTTLACLCHGLAWAYEADYFGPVFAVEAALPVSRQFDDRCD